MANTYLTRTPSSTGNRQIFTFSAWVKRSKVSTVYNTLFYAGANSGTSGTIAFRFTNNYNLNVYIQDINQLITTNRVFRDTSAWYHIVLAIDTTQATPDDRRKLYINGVQETSFSTSTEVNRNLNLSVNTSGQLQRIGTYSDSGGNLGGYFDGSMSHVHLIDGTAYDATAFGEFDANGVWKIKTSPSVTYGTNGFFILKDGNSVTDQSGNGNNFTVAGGTLTKTEDCPSNVFCTLNGLSKNQYMNLYNGNTSSETNNGNEWATVSTTLGMNGGKYYCEAKVKNNANQAVLGIYLASLDGGSQSALDSQRVGLNTGSTSGNIFVQGLFSYSAQSVSPNASNGDIYGIAFDSDNGSVQFYRNGATYGSAITNAVLQNQTFMFGCQQLNTNFDWNFGNGYFGTTAVASAGTNASGIGIFEYDVPTGFTALSTKGLNL